MSSSSAVNDDPPASTPDRLDAGHLAGAPSFAGTGRAGTADGRLEGTDRAPGAERQHDHRHEEGGAALDERRDRRVERDDGCGVCRDGGGPDDQRLAPAVGGRHRHDRQIQRDRSRAATSPTNSPIAATYPTAANRRGIGRRSGDEVVTEDGLERDVGEAGAIARRPPGRPRRAR